MKELFATQASWVGLTVAFAGLATILLLAVSAGSGDWFIEAESTNITGNAEIVADESASGESYLMFGEIEVGGTTDGSATTGGDTGDTTADGGTTDGSATTGGDAGGTTGGTSGGGSGEFAFFDDFTDPEWESRYDFNVFHRDFGIDYGQTWMGDHQSTGPNDLCSAPEERRVINLGTKISRDAYNLNDFNDEWIYRCEPGGNNDLAHIMTSIGDVNGYSIGAFAPKQTFNNLSEVRWDVNQTDLGDRQWTEVAIIPASNFDLLNLPCQDGLPCGTDGHDINGSVGTQWGAQRTRMIITYDNPGGYSQTIGNYGYRPTPDGSYEGGARFGLAYGVDDPALTSIRIRLGNFFRDNGDGTLTWGFTTSDGETNELTVPGSFPEGPVRVVFKDHSYTPLKSPATLLPETTFTWHWDDIIVIED